MCNHYEKNAEAMERAVRLMEAQVTAGAAAAMREWREHTYPKYPAGIITQSAGVRELVVARWGVWPFYARAKPQYITNARSDGLLTKATWKNSAKKRRCLVPATGYFEPGLGPPGARGEVRFAPIGQPSFFIAGLFDHDPDEAGARGFALVTCEPNEYAKRFHDRMPVVLTDEQAAAWLGDAPLPDEQLLALCRGLPAEQLTHTEIAAAPKGKITTADLSNAIEMPRDEQGDLFA